VDDILLALGNCAFTCTFREKKSKRERFLFNDNVRVRVLAQGEREGGKSNAASRKADIDAKRFASLSSSSWNALFALPDARLWIRWFSWETHFGDLGISVISGWRTRIRRDWIVHAGAGVGTAIASARFKWRVIARSDRSRSLPIAVRQGTLISRRDYRRCSRPTQTLNWNRGSLSVTLVHAPMCNGLIRGEISIVNWQRTCDPSTCVSFRPPRARFQVWRAGPSEGRSLVTRLRLGRKSRRSELQTAFSRGSSAPSTRPWKRWWMIAFASAILQPWLQFFLAAPCSSARISDRRISFNCLVQLLMQLERTCRADFSYGRFVSI